MRQADSSSCSLLGMTNPLGFCELFRPALHWLRMHFIYGINAVTEALKARGRAFEWVGVAKDRHDLRLQRVVVPERRAVGVTGTVAKVSAGASEHLPIAKVTNIARTLEDLKTKNLWIVGLDERGMQTYDSVDYKMDCAIALGAEGKGLHDLVRKRCDFIVSIPMLGKVPSLNVSVAAGIVLYEVVRQRK